MPKCTFFTSGIVRCCAVALSLAVLPFDSARAVDDVLAGRKPIDACVQGNNVKAEQRILACSQAIQSARLTDRELALAHLNRGGAYRANGDEKRAAADYAEALLLYDKIVDPKQPDGLIVFQRATALLALGRFERALADYDEAVRLDARNALPLIDRGVVLVNRWGDYARAIADFDKALELAPDNVVALINRGDTHRRAGEIGRSLADLKRAVELAPDSAQAHIYLGRANDERGDLERAAANYDAALALEPRNHEALVARAALYSNKGEQDKAIGDLDLAIAIRANDPVAFYDRGYAYFGKGQYDQAIADYSAAIDLDPAMAVAYNNRCLTRTIVGRDLPQALSDCGVALDAMPDNLDVRETLGFIYLKLGDFEIAIFEYDAALKLDPTRALSLYGRGLARIKKGDKAGGEADRVAGRALDPTVEREFSKYGVE